MTAPLIIIPLLGAAIANLTTSRIISTSAMLSANAARNSTCLRGHDNRLQRIIAIEHLEDDIMPARQYSADEISSMRASIRELETPQHSYYAPERDAQVERVLRTHLMNGTSPDELLEAAKAAQEERFATARKAAEMRKLMVKNGFFNEGG